LRAAARGANHRKREARTNIASLEANRYQSSCVACDPWPGCRPRTLPQCTWWRDDPDGIRIRAQAAPKVRKTELSFVIQQTRFAAHLEARLRDVHTEDHP